MIFHIEFQYEIEVIYAKEEIVFIVLDICNVPKQIKPWLSCEADTRDGQTSCHLTLLV